VLKLPVYFVSDNHFKMDVDDSEKDRRSKLYHVFDKIKSTGGSLVIGGDFFDFWFNYRYVVPSGYVDLLEQLHQLNQSGVAIHFVLGNHDYWDFGYFKEKFSAEVYSGNLDFNQNDSQIQVCHGDGILKNDYGYRFMKKIIRSSLCIQLFKLFHPDWGCGLAKKVSETSGNYHHHDLKADAIRTELIEYGRSQWELGFNTVLLGHYHQTGIVEEDGNSLIFMGDWLRHFTVTRLDNNGWWQGKWDEV
jgi:UDP-2,3-diacylglucosamine hydrolase